MGASSTSGDGISSKRGLFALSNSPLLLVLARHEVHVGLALALLAVAPFAAVCNYGYVNFDDPLYVTHNMDVHEGLTPASIVWSFTTFYTGNWHPLTWLSLQLDVELFGSWPTVFHRTNLALHVLNVLLLYGLLVRMAGSWPPSALVAALFAVHPLHVESVAWITERKDVLSTFFGLLAIAAYLSYVRRPSLGRYSLLMLAYAASLASKQMLVTLPFLLLLLDWWPLRRMQSGLQSAGATPQPPFAPTSLSRLLLEKLPLLALALVAAIIVVCAQNFEAALKSTESFPLSLRLANALDSTAIYLGQTLWPSELVAYYPYPYSGISPWRLAVDCVPLLAISILAIGLAWSRPYVLMGWLWFLIALAPVIGLVQVGQQSRADRYTYVPHIGFFIAVVWLLWEACSGPRRTLLFSLIALLLLTPCALLTRQQVRYWENSELLWRHTLALTGDNPLALTNYAHAVMGEHEDEAVEHLEKAVSIYPKMDRAWMLLGAIHEKHGRRQEALACYQKALAVYPGNSIYQWKVRAMEGEEAKEPAAP